ncbi:RDD family protein [Altericista sp. CCNU0014]|uniref:RDD family protein n=1 Tax=Altericista sp. CCNU0014 TaxID=3082949 RepID=UPI00384AED3F
MTPKPDSIQASVPSLTMGNVITIGFQVFRLNFNDHFVRSLLSHLWLWLAMLGGLLVFGIALFFSFALSSTGGFPNTSAGVLGVAIGTVFALPFTLFTGARMFAVSGLMTRMGFNTLRKWVEPDELYRQTILRRLWTYLAAWVFSSLIVLLICGWLLGIGFYVFVLLSPTWQAFLLQIADSQLRGTFVLVTFTLGLIYVLGAVMVGYYLSARLWFFDAVLAIEDRHSALTSLLRSWELTRGKGWSVITIMFTASLITLPILLLASSINVFVPFVSLIAGVIMLPLWQAVKAVNFYELVTAKTGLLFDLDSLSSDPRRFLRRVAMQTPEGVELDFALGGIGSRAIAWMVDQTILYLVLAVFWVAGGWTYIYVVLPMLTDRFEAFSVDELNLWVGAIAGILSFAIANGYFISFETIWRGQTPGKRLAKIRVVRDDGQPIGVKEATLRSFVGWFDLGFFFIGLMLVMLGRSEKRLGDMAAGTLVIQDEKSSQQGAAIVPTSFSTLTKDTVEILTAQTNTAVLSMDRYFVLQNFLGHRAELSAKDRKSATSKLARQLRSLLMPHSPDALGTIPDENLVEAAYLVCRVGRDDLYATEQQEFDYS